MKVEAREFKQAALDLLVHVAVLAGCSAAAFVLYNVWCAEFFGTRTVPVKTAVAATLALDMAVSAVHNIVQRFRGWR